jgi:hypothetical protein
LILFFIEENPLFNLRFLFNYLLSSIIVQLLNDASVFDSHRFCSVPLLDYFGSIGEPEQILDRLLKALSFKM